MLHLDLAIALFWSVMYGEYVLLRKISGNSSYSESKVQNILSWCTIFISLLMLLDILGVYNYSLKIHEMLVLYLVFVIILYLYKVFSEFRFYCILYVVSVSFGFSACYMDSVNYVAAVIVMAIIIPNAYSRLPEWFSKKQRNKDER